MSNDQALVNQSVARGATVLDQRSPGWERKIDLSTLDLTDHCRCVLGQLYNEYLEGVRQVFDNNLGASWVSGFGCHPNADVKTTEDGVRFFRMLDEAWISLIKERFDSGILSDS